MVDTVKDLGPIIEEIESVLKGAARTAQLTIETMRLANTDFNRAHRGWVGIYIDSNSYQPRAAGTGQNNWTFDLGLRLIVQAANMSSSLETTKTLQKRLKDVLDVVLSSPTLAANLDAIVSLDVEYAYDENDSNSMHMQVALVSISYEGMTN